MKYLKKIFYASMCACALLGFGERNAWAVTAASGFNTSTLAICSGYGRTIMSDGKTAQCNCYNGKPKDREKQYIYPDGHAVPKTFPKIMRCAIKGRNNWGTEIDSYCSGFDAANYNAGTMTPVFAGDCWSWKCSGSLVLSSDKKSCVEKDPNAETDANGNVLSPCDTTSTVTVKLNGVDKTVPANTRMDGKCVPTCQSDTGSRIDTSDPTEFVITVG